MAPFRKRSGVPAHAGMPSTGSTAAIGISGLGFAGWLSLAGAPTFVAMAVITALIPGMPMMCDGGETSLLTGMPLMYLLMSLFHLVPWLRLISQARKPR